MLNSFVSAKLFPKNIIKVFVFSELEKNENEPILLVVNKETFIKLDIIKSSFLNGVVIYECKSPVDLNLGNDYYISIKDFGIVPLNVDCATEFDDFDEKFSYDGDDLGAIYSKEKTSFKLWAPLASKVVLLVKKPGETNYSTYVMNREEKGVYSYILNGDYDGAKYLYSVTNSGLNFVTTDPYAKGSTANGKHSVVVNFDKVKIDLNDEYLPNFRQNSDAIVYELDVRDFTIDINNNTNIVNKGKYLGLTEENRKTKKNHPAGLDYLSMLGVSHVQILPMYDFKTINEEKPLESYNWGYDPQQYFVPEGSYSTDPNDAYSRIKEVKQMVASLHKKGIRVNMDVVFNHVYDYQNNVFEKIVPNYYFRKTKNGRISNDSYCGCDLDTKRPMVRKMIIDSLVYWVKEYGVDGYRFDLLGLMDIETAKQLYKKIKAIKPEAMIYGEGWEMANSLKPEERTSYLNAFKVPGIGFFNDSFRDIVKGPNNSRTKGYLAGNLDYLEGFKYTFLGSVVNYCFDKKFENVNQSVNYCECHDNMTLFDCLNKNIDSTETCLRIIRTINSTILLAYGVSFFHAGQEIGATKYGHDNTYNMGDKYNKFDYKLLDERYDMALYLSSVIKFKKENLRKLNLTSEEIGDNTYFVNLDNGGLIVKLNKLGEKLKDVVIIYNPTNESINIDLEGYYEGLITYAGAIGPHGLNCKTVLMNPYEVNVFVKKED